MNESIKKSQEDLTSETLSSTESSSSAPAKGVTTKQAKDRSPATDATKTETQNSLEVFLSENGIASELTKSLASALKSTKDLVFKIHDYSEISNLFALPALLKKFQKLTDSNSRTIFIRPNSFISDKSSSVKEEVGELCDGSKENPSLVKGLELINSSGLGVLNLDEVKEIDEDCEASFIVGDDTSIKKFIESDIFGSSTIDRVIVTGLSELPLLRESLSPICKRSNRPQLILIDKAPRGDDIQLVGTFFRVPVAEIKHQYQEVSGEVLSKVTALGDIIEAEGFPKVLIFCNLPSDTDLVEVILKKRDIRLLKLIGHVPNAKVFGALAQIRDGGASVLVVTDISSRLVNPGEFDIVVNYSIPTDPEVYIHRSECSNGATSLNRVISLVGPQDKANFHYLRKLLSDNEFEAIEGASEESLLKAQLNSLALKAAVQDDKQDDKYLKLAKLIIESTDKEKIVAHLLSRTAEVSESREVASAERDSSNEAGRGYNRGGGSRRGRYDSSEQQFGQFDDDSRQPFRRGQRRRDDSRSESDDRGGRRGPPNHSRSFDNGEESSNRSNQSQDDSRYERRSFPPEEQKKLSRVYLDIGTKGGLAEDSIQKILSENGVSTIIEKQSLRPNYSFIDVDTSTVTTVIDCLKGYSALQLRPVKAVDISFFSRGEEAQSNGRVKEKESLSSDSYDNAAESEMDTSLISDELIDNFEDGLGEEGLGLE